MVKEESGTVVVLILLCFAALAGLFASLYPLESISAGLLQRRASVQRLETELQTELISSAAAITAGQSAAAATVTWHSPLNPFIVRLDAEREQSGVNVRRGLLLSFSRAPAGLPEVLYPNWSRLASTPNRPFRCTSWVNAANIPESDRASAHLTCRGLDGSLTDSIMLNGNLASNDALRLSPGPGGTIYVAAAGTLRINAALQLHDSPNSKVFIVAAGTIELDRFEAIESQNAAVLIYSAFGAVSLNVQEGQFTTCGSAAAANTVRLSAASSVSIEYQGSRVGHSFGCPAAYAPGLWTKAKLIGSFPVPGNSS